MGDTEEEDSEGVLDAGTVRQQDQEKTGEDDRREPGLKEEKHREGDGDDVFGERQRELGESPGGCGGCQSRRGLGGMVSEGHEGGGSGDPGPGGPGRRGDAREREQGAHNRPQQRVRRFPDAVGEGDLGDDELGEEEDESELENGWAREDRRQGTGKAVRQQPHQAVKDQQDRPGVPSGRGGEAEPRQERGHARRRKSRVRNEPFRLLVASASGSGETGAAATGAAASAGFSDAPVMRSRSCWFTGDGSSCTARPAKSSASSTRPCRNSSRAASRREGMRLGS